jgi:putative acetyltransferase
LIGVRPEQPGDEAAVREVVAAAFGDDVVPRLLDAMRACPAWLDLSFVAEQDGDLVGHVSFTRGWLDARERLVEVLVLSPMSVTPDRQGRGVGTGLVEESLAQLEGRAEPLVFLEGSPGYYARFGFVAGGTLGFTAPSDRIPSAAFQVLTRPSYRPWMQGALVYPDVFWAHDSVGLR